MTKKKKWMIACVAMLLVFIIPFSLYMGARLFYLDIEYYQSQWGVTLPKYMKLEYGIDDIGFPSDGTAYSVRKVLQDTEGLFMDFSSEKDAEFETSVNTLLNSLNVPADKLPDWSQDYQWQVFQSQNFDELYVFYIPSSKTLNLVKFLS